MTRGIVTAQKFGLVIFDEAHRTIGDYAYAQIAELLAPNTRIVGMTATLPSENIKARLWIRFTYKRLHFAPM